MDTAKWTKSKIITSLQALLLVLSLAALAGLMGWLFGGRLFAFAAVGAVVMFYILNPMVSPLLTLRMHRARRLTYDQAPRLYRVLQTLSERAELPRVPGLYYLPGQTMNAFTVGTRQEAAIAVSDGLLRRLNEREISAVLAHEVSHIRHNDIRMMGFANLSNVIVQRLSVFGQFLLILNFPMLLMGQYTISWTAIGLLIFAPSISTMLQLALSRTREYNADLSAAELMDDSEALASALTKMDTYHSWLFRNILWPGYTGKAGSSLFRTHPPTKERIRRLLEIRNQHSENITNGILKPHDKRYRRTIWRHPVIQSPWS
jgi:heat shock protein HtpX